MTTTQDDTAGAWVRPYYDRQGQPITRDEYLAKSADDEYTLIARDSVGGGYSVITIWLGAPCFADGDKPIIFESASFERDKQLEQRRYATEDEARSGHALLVHDLKARIKHGGPR